MATTLEELRVLITGETAGLRKELARVKQDFGGLSKEAKTTSASISKAFGAVKVALVALGIGKLVKDSINAASQLEGAMMGLTSIVEGHGMSMQRANRYIQEYIQDGLVPLTSAVTAYKNLAARGYSEDQIQNVMSRLKDSAAFGRQASYTLGQAVESATEGLKNENSILVDNAGVTKNVAKMWEEYAATIGTTRDKLTQQQKIQAEVNGIMQETQFQVGDAAKYTNTYAGRIAALQKTLQDIKVSLGQAFMPIANVVLPLLQTLANAVAKVMAFVAQFMQALFGVAKGQQLQADSANKAAQAQINVGNAAETAGKKAKKAGKEAKGALAGFDQLNLITQPKTSGTDDTGSGSVDSGAGGINIPDIAMPEIDTNTIPTKVTEMVDNVKRIFRDMWEGASEYGNLIAEAYSGIRPALQPIIDAKGPIMAAIRSIGATAKEMYQNFLKPAADYILLNFIPQIVTGFTQSFAPVFANVAVSAVQIFADTFRNISETASQLWDTTWLPALERIKQAYLTVMPQIAGAMQNVLDGTIKPFVNFILNDFIIPISAKIHEVLVPILTDVLIVALQEVGNTFEWAANLMNDIYSTVIEPVFQLLKTIVMDTLQIIQDLWAKYGKTLLNNLSETMEGLRKLFQKLWDDILKPIIQPFLEMLTWLWDKHLKGLVKEIGEFVMKLVNAALEILNKFILPVISYIVDKLKPAFVTGFNFIADVVGTVVGTISDVLKGLIKSLGGIVDFIAGVFTGNWKKAWQGIQDFSQGLADALVGIFKGAINLIVDALNFMINSVNKVNIKIPDWVPGDLGGKELGLKIPNIPKLDVGTNFVARDGLAFLHEGEAVVPKKFNPAVAGINGGSDNREMVTVLNSILQTLRKGGGDLILQVDSTTIGRVAANGINDIARRTGRTPLTL
ncbi:phage-related protein [Paenibacillus anaericanus]|uniref:phage tail protein n=1 Tax=Paenibacillus anaericanus TaxID=170367 RepID=UPI00278931DE|nr:hypothetical protein [Paenibacillus anaericanus]MDQ0091671.1 phage-related protein [Paenibacillus anaericanus]